MVGPILRNRREKSFGNLFTESASIDCFIHPSSRQYQRMGNHLQSCFCLDGSTPRILNNGASIYAILLERRLLNGKKKSVLERLEPYPGLQNMSMQTGIGQVALEEITEG